MTRFITARTAGRKKYLRVTWLVLIDRCSPPWHCSSFDSDAAGNLLLTSPNDSERKNGGKLLLNVSSLSNVLPLCPGSLSVPRAPEQISFEAPWKQLKRFSFQSMRERFTRHDLFLRSCRCLEFVSISKINPNESCQFFSFFFFLTTRFFDHRSFRQRWNIGHL